MGRGRHKITERRQEVIEDILKDVDEGKTVTEITSEYLLRTDIAKDMDLINSEEEFDKIQYKKRVNIVNQIRYVLENYGFTKKEIEGREPLGKVLWSL